MRNQTGTSNYILNTAKQAFQLTKDKCSDNLIVAERH